jgi:hypothetical protein
MKVHVWEFSTDQASKDAYESAADFYRKDLAERDIGLLRIKGVGSLAGKYFLTATGGDADLTVPLLGPPVSDPPKTVILAATVRRAHLIDSGRLKRGTMDRSYGPGVRFGDLLQEP